MKQPAKMHTLSAFQNSRWPFPLVANLQAGLLPLPKQSRLLTIKGADALIAPSAWVAGEMKEEHWLTMIKARAIENGSYVIAPDQVGNIYCGKSMVVDPFGVVLLDMGQREGIETVDIDKARIQQVRRSLPLLKNRRTDVYKLSHK